MAAADPRVVQARLIATTDAELQRVLLTAARQAESLLRRRLTTFSGRVSQAQLLLVQNELRALSHQLWQNKIPPEIAKQIAAAERAATVSVDEFDQVMVRSFRNSQIQEAMIRAQRARARRVADVFKTRQQSARFALSPNVYKWEALSNGIVERNIASAIARGATANDIARGVRDLIDPNVRGGISYAARRTGRTEVANAYHATTISENTGNPFVRFLEWHLSRSHPKSDVCDSLAGKKYDPLETPSKSHPQCLCYLTPVPISDAQLRRGLQNGDFNAYLSGKYPDLDLTAFAA
jgi:hypothetical protein